MMNNDKIIEMNKHNSSSSSLLYSSSATVTVTATATDTAASTSSLLPNDIEMILEYGMRDGFVDDQLSLSMK